MDKRSKKPMKDYADKNSSFVAKVMKDLQLIYSGN